MAKNRAAKKLYFDLPGIGRVQAMPGGSIDPGGFNRGQKMGEGGPVGYTEEPVAPKLSFKIAANSNDGLSQRMLSDLVDVNVTVVSDDGKSFLVRDCVTTKPVTLSDGDFDMEMEGVSVEEIG